MSRLDEKDKELIQIAFDTIRKYYDKEKSYFTVGSAIRCTTGRIYVGVNMRFIHGPCAETIAVGSAIAAGERSFECIVSVHGEGEIISPCGNCRQMIYEIAFNCDVILPVKDNGAIKLPISELMPFPYEKNTLWKNEITPQIEP